MVVAGPVDDVIERYEVSRFVYRLRILSGLDKARAVLAQHRCLVEGESIDEGLPALSVQILGGEPLMAKVLAALISAGVEVVTASRQRSRLEDVYDRISEDQVN